MWKKTKTDLGQLKTDLANTPKDSKLYKLVREQVIIWGHWKQKPRGKPNPMFTRHQ